MIGWIWKIVSSNGKFPAKLLLMKWLLFIKKSKGVLAYENLNGVSDNLWSGGLSLYTLREIMNTLSLDRNWWSFFSLSHERCAKAKIMQIYSKKEERMGQREEKKNIPLTPHTCSQSIVIQKKDKILLEVYLITTTSEKGTACRILTLHPGKE